MPLTTMATTTLVIQRHSSPKGTSLSKIYDGEYVYDRQPANRWTSFGSKQKEIGLFVTWAKPEPWTP